VGHALSGCMRRVTRAPVVMKALRDAEMRTGEMLTRNEVLEFVAIEMRRYNLPMNFTPWGGR
jgi:hypothetical protein